MQDLAHSLDKAPATPTRGGKPVRQYLRDAGPIVGLVLLCIAGTLLNPDFATWDNAMNVLTRTAFIGIIAVGMCFVIISGGIDLSVGSMAALIAGSVILFMNAMAPVLGSPMAAVVVGMLLAVVLGAVFGLVHGLLITKGRIEPFIVTLAGMMVFRGATMLLLGGQNIGPFPKEFQAMSSGFIPDPTGLMKPHGLTLIVAALAIAVVIWIGLRARRRAHGARRRQQALDRRPGRWRDRAFRRSQAARIPRSDRQADRHLVRHHLRRVVERRDLPLPGQ